MRNHLAVEVIDRIALDAFKVNVVLSANVCVCQKGNWGLLSSVEQSGNGICACCRMHDNSHKQSFDWKFK